MKKYKNAEEALVELHTKKKGGQTYSAIQVYNSAQRSEAWARRSGSAVQRAIWAKVKAAAAAELAFEHQQAAQEGEHIPCEANCEMSFSDDCTCSCGGVNHGIKAVASAS